MRGKKGPTILDQLISVDYHEKPTYDYPDDDIDFVPSNTSVVRRNKTQSEGSLGHASTSDDNKISSEGSETPIERLYDDPATDSS